MPDASDLFETVSHRACAFSLGRRIWTLRRVVSGDRRAGAVFLVSEAIWRDGLHWPVALPA